MAPPPPPNDSAAQVGETLDKCITNAVVKMGGGIIIGGVTSLLFLRRKKWPLIVGAGIGLGMAYENCEYNLSKTNPYIPDPNKC